MPDEVIVSASLTISADDYDPQIPVDVMSKVVEVANAHDALALSVRVDCWDGDSTEPEPIDREMVDVARPDGTVVRVYESDDGLKVLVFQHGKWLGENEVGHDFHIERQTFLA